MIYVVVYVLLCMLVPLGAGRRGKNVGLLAAVSIALFLFVGFRWEVGCDWTGYLNIFEVTRDTTLDEALANREPGFTLLNMALHAFELDYVWVNVAGAAVFFLGLFFFALRQDNPLAIVALSFPVLIVNMPMSGVRQGMAIGMFMLAINAYRDGKRLAYGANVLIGSAFHQSVLLFLAFAPLIRVRKTLATVAFAVMLAAPAMYLTLGSAASFYSERYGDAGGAAAGAPFRTALLMLVGLLFWSVLRKRWRTEFPDDYEIYSIASVMMLVSLPMALYSSVLGDRIGYYLVPFQVVMLERLGVLLRRDSLAPFYAVLPYLVLLVFFVSWMNLSPLFGKCYLPYQSVIAGME